MQVRVCMLVFSVCMRVCAGVFCACARVCAGVFRAYVFVFRCVPCVRYACLQLCSVRACVYNCVPCVLVFTIVFRACLCLQLCSVRACVYNCVPCVLVFATVFRACLCLQLCSMRACVRVRDSVSQHPFALSPPQPPRCVSLLACARTHTLSLRIMNSVCTMMTALRFVRLMKFDFIFVFVCLMKFVCITITSVRLVTAAMVGSICERGAGKNH